jgi:hypothetical protein
MYEYLQTPDRNLGVSMIKIKKKQRGANFCHLSILTILCLVFLSHAKTDVPVFLLSGQSNMTGYGGVSGLTTDQKRNVDNVKIYMDLVWEGDPSKLRKWLTLGIGFGSKIDSIGPELFLGRTLSDSMPGKKIAFIKCSSGSTYLGKVSDWLPPSSNSGTGGTLYNRMMSSIDVALKSFNTAFDTAQYTPKWAGFVWLQGEFDAMDKTLSNAYETNLTNLIKDIRAKLNVPDLPVIIPMIDVQGAWTNNSIIRAADIAVTKKFKNVDTLDTKGFSTDGVHYRGQGQVKIGTTTAQRWLNMNFNYGPTMIAFPNSMVSRQIQSAELSKSILFDLSGKRISAVEVGYERQLQTSGIFIAKTNQYGRTQGKKIAAIEK